ncbi:PDR/VanB family oxidoreductase [Nocardia sp. NPDC060220]|uniref:PDR/VanB family oxidoreductase n=1 Tax=Nocardia sp. NPDC060220 TaxID=3347076 RepID=UPI00364A1C1D
MSEIRTTADRVGVVLDRRRIPPSFTDPNRPDRVMRAYRSLLRFYSALSNLRLPATGPAVMERGIAVRVVEKTTEALGVVSLTLRSCAGTELPRWHPGSHIDVTLPSGTVRQYSLCGDPDDRTTYRIAVRWIDGGTASTEIHDDVREGSILSIRGPRNAFPFADPGLSKAGVDNIAFVAGGIGITALLPMIGHAHRSGLDWTLTYFGRNEATLPFLAELAATDRNRVRVLTTERNGRPDPAELLADVRAGSSIYYCGPPVLHDTFRAFLPETGAAGLHFERFSAPPVVGGEQFRIRLARTGTEVEVTADQSALSAVRATRPGTAYSCQQGFCGTCRVKVLAGAVESRGTARFLDEPDTMLLCTDRAQEGQVVVDL